MRGRGTWSGPSRALAVAAVAGVLLGSVVVALEATGAEELLPHETAEQGSPGRAVFPYVAYDEFPPTPTPPPEPAVAPYCYEPRPEDTRGYVMLPAAPDSLFTNCQVIQYYGYPGVPVLGILGEFGSPNALADDLAGVVANFDGVNGPRRAIGAFHILATVAQASPGSDGTYVSRIPTEVLDQYIAAAERHDMLVFLDLQLGRSTVEAELERLLPYLRNPRVHLALDPEWAMPPGVAPGTQIGSLDAAPINHALRELQAIADESRDRGNKILIVHQFTESMITNKDLIQDQPDVDFVIDMDGFGGREIKLKHYQWYVVDDGAEHSGMKLFFDEDIDIFSPAEVSEIVPQPDIVQYQ